VQGRDYDVSLSTLLDDAAADYSSASTSSQ